MGEYGGHVPKRIQTEPVETPLINGHTSECIRVNETGDAIEHSYFRYSCPGCLKHYLEKH